MADFRKDPASDDYLVTTAAFSGKLGDALALVGTGGELFVAQIGGTGFTHADVSAAITAYNASTSTRAIIHIADVSANWGAFITISKPIKFIGIIENAGILGSSPPSVNFVDTADPILEFDNVGVFTSPGDGPINLFDSVVLKFKQCLLSNTGDSGVALFEMVGAAGGAGKLRVFAEDTTFFVEAGVGTAVMFLNSKTGADVEMHLDHCAFANGSGGTSGGVLVETNGGDIRVFAKNGTALFRAGFKTAGTGSRDLDVTYDGSSLVTDKVSGGVGETNSILGTTTVHGEAAYNTTMDTISTLFLPSTIDTVDVQRALSEFMGSDLRLAAGTYATTTAIAISASDKVIRAAGKHATVIDSNIATAIVLDISGSRNLLSGLTLTTNTTVPGSILRISGNDNVAEDVKILVPNVGVWTAAILVDLTGNQNRVQDTLIDPTGRTILTAIRLSGTENYVYKVTYRPSNNGDATTVFESTATGTRSVFEHNVIDLTGTSTITQAFLVGADDTVVSLNNLYSGGAAAIGAGILTVTTPSSCVFHANKIDEDVGTGTVGIDCVGLLNSIISDNWVKGFGTGLRSDIDCGLNIYANNHLRGNSTPTSLNATDLVTSESTDNLE